MSVAASENLALSRLSCASYKKYFSSTMPLSPMCFTKSYTTSALKVPSFSLAAYCI